MLYFDFRRALYAQDIRFTIVPLATRFEAMRVSKITSRSRQSRATSRATVKAATAPQHTLHWLLSLLPLEAGRAALAMGKSHDARHMIFPFYSMLILILYIYISLQASSDFD